MACSLPPPVHSAPPPHAFCLNAEFYETGFAPSPSPPNDTAYIHLPPSNEWVDHQAVTYKVRKYLLSKTHSIKVYPNGRWCVFDKQANEIETLMQWCHLTRTIGLHEADEVMLFHTPHAFSEPIDKKIYGIVDPSLNFSLGLSNYGELGRQCSFLCHYTGPIQNIFDLHAKFSSLTPILSPDEYNTRIHFSRLGNPIDQRRLLLSYCRWYPGKPSLLS